MPLHQDRVAAFGDLLSRTTKTDLNAVTSPLSVHSESCPEQP